MGLAWNRTVEAVAEKYNARALAVLQRIAAVCALPHDEPQEMHGDDAFRWMLCVFRPGSLPGSASAYDDGIDVSLQLDESLECEGTEDGITFSIHVVHVGGRIVGDFTPYNYTSKVWVLLNDAEAIEARFRLIEDVDASGLVQSMDEWFDANPRK